MQLCLYMIRQKLLTCIIFIYESGILKTKFINEVQERFRKRKCEVMENKYYSDLITEEQIKKWSDNNEYVYLNGDTGTGKTTFIFNKLIPYIVKNTDKFIFVLSNRKYLSTEHKNGLRKSDIYIDFKETGESIYKRISIMTYQCYFDKYATNNDFIVDIECGALTSNNIVFICDECHYFLTDNWNRQTTTALKTILELKSNTYFVSATGNNIINFINTISSKKVTEENTVRIEQDYKNISLKSYKDNKELSEARKMITEILDNTNDKVIYYRKNKKQLSDLTEELKEKYSDNIKLCYSENTKANNLLPNELETAFTEDKKMNCRCILTTNIIDNGIDIYDSDLKHIIVDMTEPEIIIQSIGRKRDKEPLTVYINQTDGRTLNYNIKRNTRLEKETHSELNRYQYRIISHDLQLFKNDGAVNTIYSRLKHTGIRLHSEDSNTKLMIDLQYHAIHEKPIDKEYLISLLSDVGIKAKQLDKINAAFTENNIKYKIINKRERVDGCKNAVNVWYVSA